MKKRDSFATRLGFIMVSAGCAIGIGNVWKFPFITGRNGGAFFVLFYLIFLLILGIPVMTMELAVGRASKKSVVLGYKALEKPGAKWHIHGWFCIAGCWLLMMYYTTVSGWMLGYFWKFLTGRFEGVEGEAVDAVFGEMLSSPAQLLILMAIVVIAGFLVCSFSVAKGLEKVTTVMMVALLILIVVLAIHSLTLPGASEGIKFYLLPDISKALDVGILNVLAAAMNQAFFTLSLGVASIEIFGSYMSDEHTLTGESIRIVSLDTFVAIVSGLIIFPACFSFNVAPAAGPSLIFVTLPRIFASMAGGRIWGTLFFLFMVFASFSTVIAVFENLIASNIDNFKWSRVKSVVISGIAMLILSAPCALGYNLLSNVHIIGARDILDSEDFIVSNILLPVGALIFLLFCCTKWGWGFDNYLAEANKGSGIKMARWFRHYFRFVMPVLILAIFIFGLIGIG
ncbi:MAG: sodium-dependent transporter [Lachnospiraceae bacterium]|nr:sodium-dependent transporter [Lachnospiraceae bacterium]